MSCYLDQAGRAITAIADAGGESHEYLVRRPEALAPPCVFGRDFVKIAPPRAEAIYHVRLWPGGRWSCDCPDQKYARRRNRSRGPGEPCKHCDEARAIKELLEAL